VTPRLYLDEDVVPELARMLRSHGHDAVSAHEVSALQLEDAEQLERASADGRTHTALREGAISCSSCQET